MGWEKEQQPNTSRNHGPDNFAAHFGPASLKQMVPSTAGLAMEAEESILVGQLFLSQLISQAVQWEVVDQIVGGMAEGEFRKSERSRRDRGQPRK